MLYVVKCRLCNFLMLSVSVSTIKQQIAGHFTKSHGLDYLFVADVPLKDFEDVAVVRIRDKTAIKMLLKASKSKRFYHVYRNHRRLAEALNLPFISGLDGGENKPFV